MNQESRKKILMLSIDRNILIADSESFMRMRAYGSIADELHIVIFSAGKRNNNVIKLAENVHAYATNSTSRFFYLYDAYRIASIIIKNKSTAEWLITSQDAFTHPVGVWLRRKFKIALEIQIHTDFMSPYFRCESLLNFCRYLIYSWAIKKADAIRVVSERIWQSLKAKSYKLKAKIYVLPVFVDVKIIATAEANSIRNRYPQYNFIILMASRLTCEKRIIDALAAFKLVVERFAGKRPLLLIAGDGPEKNNLELRTKNLGLDDNVKFVGAVSSREMQSYYSSADVFLLTSAYEGYGRTIIEAIAAKTPVIMTDVGVAREVVTNGVTGTVIPVDNTDKLAEAIFDATQNYQKYQKFAFSAYELLKHCAGDEKTHHEKMKCVWEEISYNPSL